MGNGGTKKDLEGLWNSKSTSLLFSTNAIWKYSEVSI